MAKLIIKNEAVPSITASDKKIIITAISNTALIKVDKLSIGGSGGGSSVTTISKAAENIITKKPDGIYANVDKPDDILSFIAAMDAAIN